tara:strand:- start:307 stop:648 length:342 start_codon:yes stop_codon:yes gene_type:complete
MKDITSLCKRVICVHKGSITYDGKLDELLRKLSPIKEISIVCRSEEDAIQLKNSGFSVKNISKNEITIKVENKSITTSLRTILNNFDIEDLYINEPPVDEIIGKILIKKDYDL